MQLREILTIEASIKEVQPHSDSCPTSSSSSVLLFISLFFFHGRSRNSPLIFLSWPETQRKVVANSERIKKKQKLSIFYVSLPTRSNSLPSSFFSVLLLSRSSLYSLLPRDTRRLNERVRDREMERRN